MLKRHVAPAFVLAQEWREGGALVAYRRTIYTVYYKYHKRYGNYYEKLEAEKLNYMELPVTLDSMEMIREIEKTKECLHGSRTGEELTREDAETWQRRMQNADGTTGAHLEPEQTRVYMESRGVDCEVWKWAAVMNMMYSDYCKSARKNSVDRPEFYADLAAAFLEDKDAPEDKAGRYCHNIAAVQE